jgi:hypothetical protein
LKSAVVAEPPLKLTDAEDVERLLTAKINRPSTWAWQSGFPEFVSTGVETLAVTFSDPVELSSEVDEGNMFRAPPPVLEIV